MRLLIPAVALMIVGGCSTTPPPVDKFPQPDQRLMIPCEAPRPLPDSKDAPKAAEALATVTSNYGSHYRCKNTLDSLQDWVRQQEAIK